MTVNIALSYSTLWRKGLLLGADDIALDADTEEEFRIHKFLVGERTVSVVAGLIEDRDLDLFKSEEPYFGFEDVHQGADFSSEKIFERSELSILTAIREEKSIDLYLTSNYPGLGSTKSKLQLSLPYTGLHFDNGLILPEYGTYFPLRVGGFGSRRSATKFITRKSNPNLYRKNKEKTELEPRTILYDITKNQIKRLV